MLSLQIAAIEQIRQTDIFVQCVIQRLGKKISLDEFFKKMANLYFFIGISKRTETRTDNRMKRQMELYIIKVISFTLIMNKSILKKYFQSKKNIIPDCVYESSSLPWLMFRLDKLKEDIPRQDFLDSCTRITDIQKFWNTQKWSIPSNPVMLNIISADCSINSKQIPKRPLNMLSDHISLTYIAVTLVYLQIYEYWASSLDLFTGSLRDFSLLSFVSKVLWHLIIWIFFSMYNVFIALVEYRVQAAVPLLTAFVIYYGGKLAIPRNSKTMTALQTAAFSGSFKQLNYYPITTQTCTVGNKTEITNVSFIEDDPLEKQMMMRPYDFHILFRVCNYSITYAPDLQLQPSHLKKTHPFYYNSALKTLYFDNFLLMHETTMPFIENNTFVTINNKTLLYANITSEARNCSYFKKNVRNVMKKYVFDKAPLPEIPKIYVQESFFRKSVNIVMKTVVKYTPFQMCQITNRTFWEEFLRVDKFSIWDFWNKSFSENVQNILYTSVTNCFTSYAFLFVFCIPQLMELIKMLASRFFRNLLMQIVTSIGNRIFR
jgi:hypothetical protein